MDFTYHHIGLVIVVDSHHRQVTAHFFDSRNESWFQRIIFFKSLHGFREEIEIDALVILGVQEEMGLQRGLRRRVDPVIQRGISINRPFHRTHKADKTDPNISGIVMAKMQ